MSTEEWLNDIETNKQGMGMALDAASSLQSLIEQATESSDSTIVRLVSEYLAYNRAANRLGYYVEVAATRLPKEEENEDANG